MSLKRNYLKCTVYSTAQFKVMLLTCTAVVKRPRDGLLKVYQLDLLSLATSLAVLHCQFVDHIFPSGAGDTNYIHTQIKHRCI